MKQQLTSRNAVTAQRRHVDDAHCLQLWGLTVSPIHGGRLKDYVKISGLLIMINPKYGMSVKEMEFFD